MIFTALWVILGLVLGLAVPKPAAGGWLLILVCPFVFAVLVMVYELVKGNLKIQGIRDALSRELGLDPSNENQGEILFLGGRTLVFAPSCDLAL